MNSYNLTEILGISIYYFLFFLVIFFGLLKFAKLINEKILIATVSIILIFIAGFRGNGLDKDYSTYINSFTIVRTPLEYFTNYSDWNYFELFYYLIPSILKTIGFPFYKTFLFLLFACLGVLIKGLSIKKMSTEVGLSLLLYFSFSFFLHEMTQIRIGVVSGCLLLCSYFYYHKKYAYFFLILAFSVCFQYTGILIGLIFILNRERFNLTINLLLLLLSFLCVLLRVNVIDEFLFVIKLPFTDKLMLTLKTLTKEENQLNAFNVPYMLNFLVTIWLFIHHKKIKLQNQYGTLLLKIQLISFICFGLFSSVAVMAFRLYEFFGIVTIITTTFLVYTTKYKYVARIGVVVYSLLIMINMLHITKLIAPYQFIFLQD